MDCDLDECYTTAFKVTKEAGVMIKEAFILEKRIEIKSSVADLVTETDKKVEEMIISTLKKKFPSHRFIGEESVAAGAKCDWTDNPTWIIDPVDGTTNFVHRFPFVCISLALTINKVTEIGLVYNPILDHMYTARRGQGAFCNNERIQVSQVDDMSKSLICAEFGSGRDPAVMDSKFRTMKKIIMKCHGVRIAGSAALDMCHVAGAKCDAYAQHGALHCWDMAAGELIVKEAGGVVLSTSGNGDAYYEYGIHCWDMVASALIVLEAGGVVLDPKGGEFDLMSRRVLCAGTEKLAKQIAECIETIELERD